MQAVAASQHCTTGEDRVLQLREHVLLAPYTTLGLGGEARYFIECSTEEQVGAALSYAAKQPLPVYVLGGGSNIVFLDSGFSGLVLRITIGGIELRDGPGPELGAGACLDWGTLARSVSKWRPAPARTSGPGPI